jgi:hypothetical protein
MTRCHYTKDLHRMAIVQGQGPGQRLPKLPRDVNIDDAYYTANAVLLRAIIGSFGVDEERSNGGVGSGERRWRVAQ